MKYLFYITLILIGNNLMIKFKKPRGIRNNNPGNIRKSDDRWLGLAIDQNDKDFFVFTEPVFGIRALMKILINYQERYGLNTVEEIIERYAPGHENPTIRYSDFVAKEIGFRVDESIYVKSNLVKLAKAIVYFENGQNPYDDKVFNDAALMLYNDYVI